MKKAFRLVAIAVVSPIVIMSAVECAVVVGLVWSMLPHGHTMGCVSHD